MPRAKRVFAALGTPERKTIMPLDNLRELFDVCDSDDQVIGQATRGEVHARGLLHRAVHIWVFDSEGRLLLHRRTATKDEYPGCFTSSASGHLNVGEDYETAAMRELEEELGLIGELHYLAKLPAGPETANEHTALFRLITDAVPSPDPAEIESIEYLPLREIDERVKSFPEVFTPPFRSLWEWFREQPAPASRA